MREQLSSIISEKLRTEAENLKADFRQTKVVQTRFIVVDDVLPPSIASRVSDAFPPNEQMRLLSSIREKKFTSKALDRMDPIISDVIFAFQSPDVIKEVSRITGFSDMIGDPSLYAGGISSMAKGHFLNPHIDNSHDSLRHNYRMLNLLYYVTPDWRADFGGSFELWDQDVRDRIEIPSLFNRLVIIETNSYSWHSVNRITTEGNRRCVSNYYFSPHPPTGKPCTHVTFFQARPEQPFLRLLTTADSYARTALRWLIRGGLGRKDIYEEGAPRK